MVEIRESGLTFLEWEALKEQPEPKNATGSTVDSFSSCNSEEVSGNNMSGVESLCDSWEHAFGVETQSDKLEISKDQVSLNDTWEIQERMLALAEKLERGEDIPELGICHTLPKTTEENKPGKEVHKQFLFKDDAPDLPLENNFSPLKLKETLYPEIEGLHKEQLKEENPIPKREDSIEYLVKQLESSASFIMKTPSKTFCKSPQTPLKTSSSQKPKIKPNSSFRSKISEMQSPVGMYIRSLPEPILIENIRSSKNHKIINTNESNAKEAIRKSDGRWSIDDKKISIEMKENLPDPAEIIPVLPTVLHKAAASMVSDIVPETQPTTPWCRGKIGKLLERNITPTVLKHQGRIQISKDKAHTSHIVHSPKSFKPDERSENHRKFSLMDVSVLEHVSGNSPFKK